jgi:hypothetical protein
MSRDFMADRKIPLPREFAASRRVDPGGIPYGGHKAA